MCVCVCVYIYIYIYAQQARVLKALSVFVFVPFSPANYIYSLSLPLPFLSSPPMREKTRERKGMSAKIGSIVPAAHFWCTDAHPAVYGAVNGRFAESRCTGFCGDASLGRLSGFFRPAMLSCRNGPKRQRRRVAAAREGRTVSHGR